jgi:thiol-disulfide isomerase/thioredoxin
MYWFRPTIVLAACMCVSLVAPVAVAEDTLQKIEGALQDGWQQVIEIPAFKTPSGEIVIRSATMTLWVEQNWLSVRRNDADGAVEWQVALAQPVKDKDTVPIVHVDSVRGGLDLSYGNYFVREHVGRLRVLRQRKNPDSPSWPKLSFPEPAPHNFGETAAWPGTFWWDNRKQTVQIKGWWHKDWCWAMSGLPGDRYDIWLRLEHKDLRESGQGWDSGPFPAHMVYGDMSASDEGDLFYAKRSLPDLANQALALQNLRKRLFNKPAPPIAANQWINSPEASSLEELRGKVVLLDFWATWCGGCVANHPKIEALHEKYKDRGLVVIGVHSAQGGEEVLSYLNKQPLPFPIAVDTGETAKRYGVVGLPAYFLIDKSGKAQWGFSPRPPSDAQIEALLK